MCEIKSDSIETRLPTTHVDPTWWIHVQWGILWRFKKYSGFFGLGGDFYVGRSLEKY